MRKIRFKSLARAWALKLYSSGFSGFLACSSAPKQTPLNRLSWHIMCENPSCLIPAEYILGMLLISVAGGQNRLRKMRMVIGVGPDLWLKCNPGIFLHLLTIKTWNGYVYFCTVINLQARLCSFDIHTYATFGAVQAGDFA